MPNLKNYDNLSASALAKITRERGLEKPNVLNTGEWAAWLREQDNPTPKAKKSAPPDNPVAAKPAAPAVKPDSGAKA